IPDRTTVLLVINSDIRQRSEFSNRELLPFGFRFLKSTRDLLFLARIVVLERLARSDPDFCFYFRHRLLRAIESERSFGIVWLPNSTRGVCGARTRTCDPLFIHTFAVASLHLLIHAALWYLF